MPEYNSQVSWEIKKGCVYRIKSADEIVTRNNLTGVRVEFASADNKDQRDYGVTLWPAPQTSATTKWGSFVSALSSNTDTWINKWIMVVRWQDRDCEIRIMPAPKPKTALGKKAVEMGGEVIS